MPAIYAKFICTWDYTKYCRVRLPPVYPDTCVCIVRNNRRLKKQQIKTPGNKIKILKMRPSYGQNLYLYYLKLLLVPCFKFCSAKITD